MSQTSQSLYLQFQYIFFVTIIYTNNIYNNNNHLYSNHTNIYNLGNQFNTIYRINKLIRDLSVNNI